MARVVIIGNASGGKSTLARKLAPHRDLPLTEIDRLLWQPGWKLTLPELYAHCHARNHQAGSIDDDASAADRARVEAVVTNRNGPQKHV